ncbi:nucleotide sugar dehydrogenase [Ferruginivarius sediminum]|uniref:UDP-glucose 6-dehydrogenase n=1 Tax=Ferruginivarius sediminum TaxID=2661937 RepID=A0A369TAT0_9PROT|nr:nucleotide sugar dehydrogenase [Ferruginivarius sediminum]RDD62378.1 nucleotide sugar dehydrogenase [Ferruginivarius sediminum]
MTVRNRKIAVFGLGYVGVVSAACLARDGHKVVGVDPQPEKVRLVREGKPPIVEQFVGELIEEGVRTGALTATTDAAEAVAASDMSLVCVGTPSRRNGSLDTAAVARVCEQIGAAIRGTTGRHVVVMRSTILPGTMRGVVIPTLEKASGMTAGEGFHVANNPEFLRESTAVYDYDNPPKTVVGATDPATASEVLSLYEALPGPKIATTVDVAEMVKYADNAWHALKVAFGNEIGNLAKAVGVDSHAVMDIFCQDEKLNISPYYLKPGYAFGGSCLPKDLRALTYKGRELDLDLPLLNSIMPSNQHQIERAFERVASYGVRRVAFLGISFKSGTDDLRESPQVALVERLIGKGYDLQIYDRNVHMARLTGANREYIVNVIPHISQLLSDDFDAVLEHGELVVIGNPAPEFKGLAARLREDQKLLDLVRTPGASDGLGTRYDGINW